MPVNHTMDVIGEVCTGMALSSKEYGILLLLLFLGLLVSHPSTFLPINSLS